MLTKARIRIVAGATTKARNPGKVNAPADPPSTQVVTPVRLNSRESQLIKEFAESRRPVPPEFATFQQGLFAKLRDRFLGV